MTWYTLGKMTWKTGYTEMTQSTQSTYEAQFKASSAAVVTLADAQKTEVRKRNCLRKL